MSSPVTAAASRIASAEPVIVALIAPALLFPSPSRLLVLSVVPLVWLSARMSGGRLVPATPLNAALIVLVGMAGVSLLVTYDVRASLGKVAGVILGALVFWAMARWTASPPRLQAGTMVFVLAGAGLAVVALLGTKWFDRFPAFAALTGHLPAAIRGVPGAEEGFQPNAVAGCLVLFVPVQIALAFARGPAGQAGRPLLRTTHVLLLALTSGTLLLTQSRGAWAGLAVSGVAFLCWYSRPTRWLATVVSTGAAAIALAIGPRHALDLLVSQSGPGMAGDVSGRLELWSRAIDGIEDFPFTGMGMNVFRKLMPAFYPAFRSSPTFDIAHAHNHLLQAALDLGIPGLVAYAAIWVGVAALLVRVYRQSADAGYRALAAGLGAGLIAHFMFSMTDAIPLGAKVGVLFWMTLALAVALHGIALPSQSEKPAAAASE